MMLISHIFFGSFQIHLKHQFYLDKKEFALCEISLYNTYVFAKYTNFLIENLANQITIPFIRGSAILTTI